MGLLKERKWHPVLVSANGKWLMNQQKPTRRGVNQHRVKWSRCQKAEQRGNLLWCLWRIFPGKVTKYCDCKYKRYGNVSTDLQGRISLPSYCMHMKASVPMCLLILLEEVKWYLFSTLVFQSRWTDLRLERRGEREWGKLRN